MISRVNVAVTPSFVAIGLRGLVVVVIDVLRATTTITRALENGAQSVIPCLEPEDAIAVRNRLGRNRVLLGGERGSQKINGFDLDNSPASYESAIVTGKTVAFTTTNGTRALQRVGHAGATAVFCGSLNNRDAIVTAIAAVDAREALLVCAGQDGEFSFEDFFCAGAIASTCSERFPDVALSDASLAAAVTYRNGEHRVAEAIASGEHAQSLAALGFFDDIVEAARLDISAVIPAYRDGEIFRRG
jgi:2-phosphosulfolactate phosphatase